MLPFTNFWYCRARARQPAVQLLPRIVILLRCRDKQHVRVSISCLRVQRLQRSSCAAGTRVLNLLSQTVADKPSLAEPSADLSKCLWETSGVLRHFRKTCASPGETGKEKLSYVSGGCFLIYCPFLVTITEVRAGRLRRWAGRTKDECFPGYPKRLVSCGTVPALLT